MSKVLFAAFLVTVAAVTPARAQDRPVQMNIGGGFTVPIGVAEDRTCPIADCLEFKTGGNFNIGVIFKPSPTFGFQVEYSYNGLGGEDRLIPIASVPGGPLTGQALLESHHNMQYIDFNGIVTSGGDSVVKPYGIGGLGAYYRSVSVTTPDVGYTTWCDPYWYVCYPTLVEIDRVIGEKSSWDFGINIGGGVTIGLGDSGAQFYVETRWHYIWGPEFEDGAGDTKKANGQYFPVTLGFRF